MEFSVNTTALLGFSDMMDRRWDDFETGRSYLKDHTDIKVLLNGGILNDIFGDHKKIVAGIDKFLSSASQVYAAGFSTAVVQADVYYRRTDAATASRMDASMPHVTGGSSISADQSLDGHFFGDPICPSARYQPPPDHHTQYSFDFFSDATSPINSYRDIIWEASRILAHFGLIPHPIDIVEEFLKPVSGDWGAYATCADAYDALALAVSDCASCINNSTDKLGVIWTGNASDGCYQASRAFAVGLAAAVEPLQHTAQVYRNVAEHVKALATFIQNIVVQVGDEVINAVLAAETGGISELWGMRKRVHFIKKILDELHQIFPYLKEVTNYVRSAMKDAHNLAEGLGIVLDRTPIPGLRSTLPSLPMVGSSRFE